MIWYLKDTVSGGSYVANSTEMIRRLDMLIEVPVPEVPVIWISIEDMCECLTGL